MTLAGPSRLGAWSSLVIRRSTTGGGAACPQSLRHYSRTSTLSKPLTAGAEASSSSYDPSVAISALQQQQQRVRQRISEIDSRLEPPSPSHVLRDRHARQHTYLRISLTEKCNLRCLYCMPEDGVPLTPSNELLSTSEVERLASLFVSQGVNKIRLTGGEPTVRSDLPQIVSSLNELKQHGLEQIGITTNGIALGKRKLDTLVQNGLTHLNVSLDTLDSFKFEFMTRRRGHKAVMDCIERALALGMPSVKINVVVIKELNDKQDVIDFVRFTKDKPITIRFIEYMPFDGNKWQVQKLVPYRDLVKTIQSEFPDFERVANRDDPNDTSKHWHVPGHQGTVGFITRLRITADGNLKVCLFGNAEVSLRDAMRTGFGPIPSLSAGSKGQPATDDQLLQLIELLTKIVPLFNIIRTSSGDRDKDRPMRRCGKTVRKGSVFMTPRRGYHSSAHRQKHSKKVEEEEEDDDDNPWGDLDKAFENLQDKSLYKQVYVKHPGSPHAPSSEDAVAPSSAAKDPIAEMEEAIFAQAGAAAVRGSSKPERNVTMAPLSGVKFSNVPPSVGGSGPDLNGISMDGDAGAKWSEYMGATGEEDDSPWSSLDAFADNPESSAQFAVPLHLQEQQKLMQASAQHFATATPQHHQQHPAADAFAANSAFIQQQTKPESSEEAMLAQAVARMLNHTSSSSFHANQENPGNLSHIDASGSASMVDVSPKPTTLRSATATGRVYMPSSAITLIRTTGDPPGKGPVLHTAQLAGIMAAKRTSDLIPLCHPLPLTHVEVKLEVEDGEEGKGWVSVECTARTTGQTGVEMEALTGCMGACLTIWDMVKAIAGKEMRIGEVKVVRKEGGKSGDWVRYN
ncbi:related to Molybdopterin biosynthesis CNX2 protein [Ustilago bromivora]|uniref:Related to Molybdopterin biosynthesis CNX2 protein n=1 Tax=Ustilago bromivora TaxID=307758 RepID=A0A1K0H7F2_9BASI|nr:related to Molybdopterin biosynthesis CNX2 protein [Ustilago bromivora]SYW75903.1 related to Molybdopterin biosynthesis CNX2 protein [Ustilago bromivora]